MTIGQQRVVKNGMGYYLCLLSSKVDRSQLQGWDLYRKLLNARLLALILSV